MSRLLLVGISVAFLTACQLPMDRDRQAFPFAIKTVEPAQPMPPDAGTSVGLKKAALPEAPDGEVLIGKCRHVALQATASYLRHPFLSNDAVRVNENDDGSYTSQVGVVLTDNTTYDESITVRYHCLFRGMSLIQNGQESEFKKN